MGFNPFKTVKKAVGKIADPFVSAAGKVSQKFIPKELRPLLPYATMFLPGSGILGAMGGAGGFAKMYAANMLTQAMSDPEADFEDLNQLSGILSGAQGALSGQYADGTNTGDRLQGMKSPEARGYQQALDLNKASGQMIKPSALTGLENRSFLTKAGDLALDAGTAASDYLTGNINTLQDVGSGRVKLFDIENAKNAAKAIAPQFAQATGDVAVNYQRPAMREFERLDAEEQAEIERTSTADRGKRANLQMKFMRQAGIPEETVEETLEVNDLGDLYTPPVETAAYGGLMGRNDYEFGGIIDAIKNIESKEMMNQNKDMSGMMNGYNMGGSVLPQGMMNSKRGLVDGPGGYAGESTIRDMAMEMNSGNGPITRMDYIKIYEIAGYDLDVATSLGTEHYKTGMGQDHKTQGFNMGGSVLPQGMEMDYRQGGFIPMGSKERADDVPARVSKNEFVMTADAVRAAGGGSVNEGAKKMYNLMNNLEAKA